MKLAPQQHSVAAELQALILETESMEYFLEAFAARAAELFSTDADILVGVTLLRNKQGATVASSSDAARVLDEVQYGYGDGPCLRAARTGKTVLIQDVRTDPRWPEYADVIRDRGFHSILGVPLVLGNDGGAGLNLYAPEAEYFTEERIAAAEAFAGEASSALQLAVEIARHKNTAEHLRAAMEARTTIDLAVGIVMAQNKCSQDAAFEILRRASSNRNVKLRDLAERVVGSITSESVETHFVN
ncbi:GAF and ANTAR domain-containing protein [Arthrobacter sp. zg-Y411]|uniref:GAF and ANTAR domain-containing protein n=1 Tax=Arthrobacter TaxID=1663 RepID=UPI001D14F494|nr:MULTISPECIES: GAF and ANTAR domain-containing protein [Arthrobacter]MCC3294397.1 GAF and ANTAR domain-containing protein [Arthrobacter zhangbolii]MDN3903181.1 GAF and ANTAR domain-containing protein [Arthrobacter sp. YD2]